MKLEIKTASENYLEENDYRGLLIIETDKNKIKFFDGEPEDNNLSRNFNACYKIKNLIEEAYQAGKNGEELSVTKSELDDWE